ITLPSFTSCSIPAKKNTFTVLGSPSVLSPNSRAPRKCNRFLCKGAPKFKGTQVREQRLSELIEKKVSEAHELCDGKEGSDECKVAWDEVEEVSQAKAHFRQRAQKEDPLEAYCKDNPEVDECRLYED
ncbi:hypothetical protein KI387_014392, partial [Taxus chinensis]